MAKKFYTDKDIDELFHNGVTSLVLTDDVVLTDLAYEKAHNLGMLREDVPPAAPVRPYLSDVKPRHSRPQVDSVSSTLLPLPSGEVAKHVELEKRIREKVAAKLGDQVDATLLDTIIQRTLKVVRLK